jgi:hypothetical protein
LTTALILKRAGGVVEWWSGGVLPAFQYSNTPPLYHSKILPVTNSFEIVEKITCTIATMMRHFSAVFTPSSKFIMLFDMVLRKTTIILPCI